jgi:hypothetical protein
MIRFRVRIPAYAAGAASVGALVALWAFTGSTGPPAPETEFRVIGIDPDHSRSIEARELTLGDRLIEVTGGITEVTSTPELVGDNVEIRLPGGEVRRWKRNELVQVIATERRGDITPSGSEPEGSLEAK